MRWNACNSFVRFSFCHLYWRVKTQAAQHDAQLVSSPRQKGQHCVSMDAGHLEAYRVLRCHRRVHFSTCNHFTSRSHQSLDLIQRLNTWNSCLDVFHVKAKIAPWNRSTFCQVSKSHKSPITFLSWYLGRESSFIIIFFLYRTKGICYADGLNKTQLPP